MTHRWTLGQALVAVLLLAALLAGLLGARSCESNHSAAPQETLVTMLGEPLTSVPGGTTSPGVIIVPASAIEVTLLHVVDGDTIRVRMSDGREERVRYIGVDAPEVAWADSAGEYLGTEASAHNEVLLASGPLRLQTDVEQRDRFGRLLAYVWAGEVFVNERMVADGYARARNYPPNLSRQERLWAAHDAAREAGIGIWSQTEH